MLEVKYDYDKALEELKGIANTTQSITREDLMVLMAGGVAEDKESATRFSSALNNFKNRKAKKANLEIIPVKDEVNKSKVVSYIVRYAKAEKTKGAKKEEFIERPDLVLSSLQKNNQKLFLELEEMKEKYVALEQRCAELQSRESSYKSIIASYHALAMN